MRERPSVGIFDFFTSPFSHPRNTLTVLILRHTMPIQPKSATMILNEYKQLGHLVVYEEFECAGHTGHAPQYGCKLLFNGHLKGTAQHHPSKNAAREVAARQAAESLLLS